MSSRPLVAFILLIAFSLQSCVTAKIVSNKQAGYTKKLNKIFIIINGAKQADAFCDGFARGLSIRLKQAGVATSTYVKRPLSLDSDEDIEKKITQYDPLALMIIHQKVVHATNNMVDGGTFEITLIDGETKSQVWKGQIEVYGQFGIDNAIDKSADELYKKMAEDKLI